MYEPLRGVMLIADAPVKEVEDDSRTPWLVAASQAGDRLYQTIRILCYIAEYHAVSSLSSLLKTFPTPLEGLLARQIRREEGQFPGSDRPAYCRFALLVVFRVEEPAESYGNRYGAEAGPARSAHTCHRETPFPGTLRPSGIVAFMPAPATVRHPDQAQSDAGSAMAEPAVPEPGWKRPVQSILHGPETDCAALTKSVNCHNSFSMQTAANPFPG